MNNAASEGAFLHVTAVEGGNAVFGVDPREGVCHAVPAKFTNGRERTGEQRIDMDSAAKPPAEARLSRRASEIGKRLLAEDSLCCAKAFEFS